MLNVILINLTAALKGEAKSICLYGRWEPEAGLRMLGRARQNPLSAGYLGEWLPMGET